MVKSQASGLDGILGGGDRMKSIAVIMSLHSFYGLMINKDQAKDFIEMMLNQTWVWWSREGILDSSGVFAKGIRSGKWTFRDPEPINSSRVGIEMECFLI